METGCLNLYKLFNGWIHIPGFIYEITELSNSGKVLISILYGCIEEDGIARPSRGELAKRLGWSMPTIDRAIKDLKTCGLIHTTKDTDISPSCYHFVDVKGYHDLIGGTVKNDRGVLSQLHIPGEKDENGSKSADPTIKNDSTYESKDKRIKESKDSLEGDKPPSTVLLKRRKDTKLAQRMDGQIPEVDKKLNLRRERYKGLHTDKPAVKPVIVPERTMEAINYWLSKESLPSMKVTPETPSRTLHFVVQALGRFFSGKLYTGFAHIKDISASERSELASMNSLDDFKTFVDNWVEVVTSNKYRVNASFLRKISLLHFLTGNPHTQNNVGGLYSPLVDYCFFEPPLAIQDKFPRTTKQIKDVWKNYIGDPEDHPEEDFIKASNLVNEIFDREFKRTKQDPSGESSFSGAIYLALNVIVDNKAFMQKKSPGILLSKWATDQYKQLWSK